MSSSTGRLTVPEPRRPTGNRNFLIRQERRRTVGPLASQGEPPAEDPEPPVQGPLPPPCVDVWVRYSCLHSHYVRTIHCYQGVLPCANGCAHQGKIPPYNEVENRVKEIEEKQARCYQCRLQDNTRANPKETRRGMPVKPGKPEKPSIGLSRHHDGSSRN